MVALKRVLEGSVTQDDDVTIEGLGDSIEFITLLLPVVADAKQYVLGWS